MRENPRIIGTINIVVSDENGVIEKRFIKNTVLQGGAASQASGLAGDVGNSFQYYIANMNFGTNGVSGSVPNFVDSSRSGLFGPVLISKPVIAVIDQTQPAMVTFTSILSFSDAVGATINELALVMQNGTYYSMATMANLTKTSSMQISFHWTIAFLT